MDSKVLCTGVLFLIAVSFSSSAGIVLTGTRIVYPAPAKEVTVSMKNTGAQAALVQSWIDTGDPILPPEKNHVPFVIMPPITRVDPGKGQTLRLIYTGGNLPTDRESVFWLNVLSVPPRQSAEKQRLLNVAYQTRLKLFYRPAGLKTSAETAPQELRWKKATEVLRVYNPTPYYITLVNIDGESEGKIASLEGEMIEPFGTLTLGQKENITLAGFNVLRYQSVDDSGKIQEFTPDAK